MGKNINQGKENGGADKAYFDALTDRVMERIQLEESVLFTNPKLKQLPFNVPEGYFEQLGSRIMESTEETKVIPLFNRTWLRYAAAVVLLLVASLAFFNPFDREEETSYLSDISEDALIEYVSTEETAIEELFIDEELMELVIDDMMADIAYRYEDLINFEKEGIYIENY